MHRFQTDGAVCRDVYRRPEKSQSVAALNDAGMPYLRAAGAFEAIPCLQEVHPLTLRALAAKRRDNMHLKQLEQ